MEPEQSPEEVQLVDDWAYNVVAVSWMVEHPDHHQAGEVADVLLNNATVLAGQTASGATWLHWMREEQVRRQMESRSATPGRMHACSCTPALQEKLTSLTCCGTVPLRCSTLLARNALLPVHCVWPMQLLTVSFASSNHPQTNR